MNYTQIGEKLGCARNTACRYVLSELENLAERCREEAVQVRDLELHRLDELYLIAYRAIYYITPLLVATALLAVHEVRRRRRGRG